MSKHVGKLKPNRVAEQVFALRLFIARSQIQAGLAEVRLLRRANPELYAALIEHLRRDEKGAPP